MKRNEASKMGMCARLSALLIVGFTGATHAAAPAITHAPLQTIWGEKVTSENAWREYPRPQMVRENWVCLNGLWDYAVTSISNAPAMPMKWDGKILVPFAIESKLSGVGRLLESNEYLWYRRFVSCTKKEGLRQLLHFDGVDFRAQVFLNGCEVMDIPHEGAQEPFTLDITDFAKEGENELVVCVWDPTEDFVQSRGKQSRRPEGCFYTRVSGIWQTVWMESVPAAYVDDFRVTPDVANRRVRFQFLTAGERLADGFWGDGNRVNVTIFEGEKKIAAGKATRAGTLEIEMPHTCNLWTPEKPFLYTFEATYGADKVRGYFAMRSFNIVHDAKGRKRFALNGEPTFILGTLDQGWWPDGLLTPPSEEAMKHDIQTLKACGFNMMRKHIKVEPRRYYYLCDTLGIMVLQDMPSSACDPLEWWRNEKKTAARYGLYRRELKGLVDNLSKVPSIVMWVPYNEGWSQPGAFETQSTIAWLKRYDPTRIVDGPSGWNDFWGGQIQEAGRGRVTKSSCEIGGGDVVDMHIYRGPGMLTLDPLRATFLGEFGGLGHPVKDHVWKEGGWGYGGIKDTATREGLLKTYGYLMEQLGGLAENGLAGSVYTQTTDVEIEINGLMTYDRKVLKMDAAALRALHEKIQARFQRGLTR